ncbi:MAG TPA: fumarylacetoacetate hydrolase family protein [Sphingopyxis sp.]|nr:fumarylacetoacetate hydrolase family protein [Sphingopyxis sp.]HMP44542.1 fumarylacetoacetate hydrolase family protein [Sphingopyxis sp.]
MKLLSFERNGRTGVARLDTDGSAYDLLSAGVSDMLALIEGRQTIAGRGELLDDYSLLAPIPRPVRDIFCVGKNYAEHAREFGGSGFDGGAKGGDEVPEAPIIFTKATTSIVASGKPIDSSSDPDATVDYEGELAVVIGRGGRRIGADDAMSHVFGYTVLNDVTAREAQKRHKQWVLGKGADSFCPVGPVILTAGAVPDPAALRLTTHVNGELRQDALVADLIFDIPTLIATLSAFITLLPGDVIATGTPAGVGIGFTPPRYLRAGDVVRVEIDAIGVLENPVI